MSRFSMSKQVAGLAGWLAVMAVVAVLGAVASINAGSFYQTLTQPEWAPPGSWFGPAWTTLYALMTLAAWLVWRDQGFRAAALPLSLFLIQLVPNVLWSWLFFPGTLARCPWPTSWCCGCLSWPPWLHSGGQNRLPQSFLSPICSGSVLRWRSISASGSLIRSCSDRLESGTAFERDTRVQCPPVSWSRSWHTWFSSRFSGPFHSV